MSDIKIFKLVNGDELIAEVVSGHQAINWKVRRVRMILMQQHAQSGQIGLGLLPWLASNIDGEVEIYSASLMTLPFDPEENLQKEYLSQTSGIALAT